MKLTKDMTDEELDEVMQEASAINYRGDIYFIHSTEFAFNLTEEDKEQGAVPGVFVIDYDNDCMPSNIWGIAYDQLREDNSIIYGLKVLTETGRE